MSRYLFVACALAFTVTASAQTGTPSSKLAWDQAAVSLAEATAYSYKLYADGSATGTALAGVTCAGATSPFTCSVNFPAFTPGAHAVQLSASNAAGESVKSASFGFTFVVIPTAPVNLRIQ